jgi:hypothetical protein
MQKHEWREQTEDGLRFYRAQHHGGNWTMRSQLKGDEEWEEKEELSREDWEKLREIIWNKYQRKRCPWEMVEGIDRRLEDLRKEGDD